VTAAPVAIVGPTASGKTGVGVLVAEALGAEIVGCDSRQIYRGLGVGTAQPTAAERARVRHHLVDAVDPAARFSAADYRAAVLPLLDALAAAGRTPLFVGGTGLWLRAALAPLDPAPPAQPLLRRWLQALAADLPGGLHPLLARVDPAAAARIHPNDRYRVVRALEVHHRGGRPQSAGHARPRPSRQPLPARVFAIAVPPEQLRARIDRRVGAMLDAGWLDEVRGLLARGLDPALPALGAVGYPELIAHLRGEATLDAAREAIRRATWQYARRQLTWFRALPGVVWVAGGEGAPDERVAAAILERLRAGEAAA
jgi:tRNA dimethylallyltransferase